jgi:hypothetical protein
MNFKRRKGVIPETELKTFSIQGKLYSEDDQPRKVRMISQSFVFSMNATFVRALCPSREKRVIERLVKDSSGKYLVIVEGIDGEGSCKDRNMLPG